MEEEREGVSWNPNILVLTRNRGRTQSQQCLKAAWVCSDCRKTATEERLLRIPGRSQWLLEQHRRPTSVDFLNRWTTTNLSIWLSCSKIWSGPARCVFLLLLLWLMLGPPTITSMLPCSAKSHIGLAKACYTCGRGLAWPEEHEKKEKRKK